MRDKIIDILLNSGTSTVMACVFCYFTFAFFNGELDRMHKKNEDDHFALMQVIKDIVIERKEITRELIDCLKAE